jgi:hypothetical protein
MCFVDFVDSLILAAPKVDPLCARCKRDVTVGDADKCSSCNAPMHTKCSTLNDEMNCGNHEDTVELDDFNVVDIGEFCTRVHF